MSRVAVRSRDSRKAHGSSSRSHPDVEPPRHDGGVLRGGEVLPAAATRATVATCGADSHPSAALITTLGTDVSHPRGGLSGLASAVRLSGGSGRPDHGGAGICLDFSGFRQLDARTTAGV